MNNLENYLIIQEKRVELWNTKFLSQISLTIPFTLVQLVSLIIAVITNTAKQSYCALLSSFVGVTLASKVLVESPS